MRAASEGGFLLRAARMREVDGGSEGERRLVSWRREDAQGRGGKGEGKEERKDSSHTRSRQREEEDYHWTIGATHFLLLFIHGRGLCD